MCFWDVREIKPWSPLIGGGATHRSREVVSLPFRASHWSPAAKGCDVSTGKEPSWSPAVPAQTWEWLRNLSAWSPLLTPPHLPRPPASPGLPPASHWLPFLCSLLQVLGVPCLMHTCYRSCGFPGRKPQKTSVMSLRVPLGFPVVLQEPPRKAIHSKGWDPGWGNWAWPSLGRCGQGGGQPGRWGASCSRKETGVMASPGVQ